MARNDQSLRQWELLRYLQTRGEGMPLKTIADHFGVGERTIQRDFELFEELGFPIEYETDDYGKRFWKLPHDFFSTGPITLGITEAISLYLAQQFLEPLAGTHFSEGLESVLQKIRNRLPQKCLEYFRGLDETFFFRQVGVTDHGSQKEKIEILSHAAHTQQSVSLTYQSIWRQDEYETQYDPYGFVFHDNCLYVVGYSHRAENIRTLKPTRIVSVTPTQMSFEKPAEFSLEARFKDSFGVVYAEGDPTTVKVKFTGTAATLIEERTWHESQHLEWLDADGQLFETDDQRPDSLVATFKLANLVEFKRWVRGFGKHAMILAPTWLQQEMKEELREAMLLYE